MKAFLSTLGGCVIAAAAVLIALLAQLPLAHDLHAIAMAISACGSAHSTKEAKPC